MKKAIAVDWLDKYGGAERVISSITKIFQFETCYTLISIMNKEDLNKVFSNKVIKVKSSFLQLFKSKFRYLFFLFPILLKKLKLIKALN